VEIYEILRLFKDPYVQLANQTVGENEYTHVTDPWDFQHLAINNRVEDAEMEVPTRLHI